MAEQALALFDVCNTLYDSNTTFDFIRFALERRRKKDYRLFRLLMTPRSPGAVALVLLGKIVGSDIARKIALAFIKGFTEKELDDLAVEFYEELLTKKPIDAPLCLMQQARQSLEVWLFSSSLEPVIKAIAAKMGVNYQASKLEYDEKGRFTGRLLTDLTGQKHIIMEKVCGRHRDLALMCSDNKTDRSIMERAQQRYVVLYKKEDRKFWDPLNPHYFEKF